ncbi:maleate cis-trans isomerase family protein [Halopenitus malekzadehii]
MIVPSSNVTMETEIPAMIRSRPDVYREDFTFHGSRMRMQEVTPEELAQMDAESVDCAVELSDARCDVISYACLIGIMAQEPGYHTESEQKLREAAADNGGQAPVVTSAGALVRAVEAIEADRIALIAPYMQNLTDTVIEYFEAEGVEVVDHVSLECPDNLEVAQLDPGNLVSLATDLETDDADALVLSACVQMPSLQSVQIVEDRLDVPVLSASIATVWDSLLALGLNPRVPDCGTLLSGDVVNSPRVDQ